MPQQTYVVYDPATGMYLIGYNIGDPPASSFGNLNAAIDYDLLATANLIAANIGGGTVGTPRPKPH